MQLLSRKIHRHIKQARRLIVAPHQNPDGDALGAAAAFHEYLAGLNKDAVIFCVTPASEKYRFVPHSGEVITDPAIFKDSSFDTVVAVDSGDLRYNGIAPFLENTNHIIINIDHHATNEQYGHFNLVVPDAASTTEILYRYFRANGVRINQKMATALLTGLTTDTGNFTNAATSSSALNAGGELIRSGGNLNLVISETLKNKSIDALRLWGAVLGRLEKDERTGIAYTYLTQKDLLDYRVPEAESEGIANFLNNLENSHIALILKELPGGRVKGSFRTTSDDVDVAALAKKLDGGGHKKAAGFTADGTIEQVWRKIKQLL